MSIYRRILGRELPCTLRQLLALEPKALTGRQLDVLERSAELGTAEVQNLYRLGMSSIAREHWGKAISYLSTAIEVHPSHIASRFALALAYEGLGQHQQAAAQLDAVLALNPVTNSIDSDMVLSASGLCWEHAGHVRLAMNGYEDALL